MTVYAIKSDTGLIKVGMTTGPVDLRRATLQTGNPHRLAVLIDCPVSFYGMAPAEIEAALHSRLAPFHAIGEWFAAPEWVIWQAFKVTVTQFHKPEIYARWHRRYGRYDRIWATKIDRRAKLKGSTP